MDANEIKKDRQGKVIALIKYSGKYAIVQRHEVLGHKLDKPLGPPYKIKRHKFDAMENWSEAQEHKAKMLRRKALIAIAPTLGINPTNFEWHHKPQVLSYKESE